jgi:hypothetical protein
MKQRVNVANNLYGGVSLSYIARPMTPQMINKTTKTEPYGVLGACVR